jgi:hypothetical protein
MKFSPKLPAILSLALLTACSATKDMDQMAKTTQDMSAKTSTMADTTTHLAATNDSVLTSIAQTNTTAKDTDANVKAANVTGQDTEAAVKASELLELYIYGDGRAPMAKKARLDALNEMEASTDIRSKVGAAACYFQGFEYQVWKNTSTDDAAKLDLLKLRAMQEFTRRLGEYLPEDFDMTGAKYPQIDTTSDDPKMQNLFALSVAAQEVYENTIPGMPSMYDLIKQALLLNGQSTQTSDWQKEALDNYPELVYFLQVRTSFFAAMTLGKMTNIAEIVAQTKKLSLNPVKDVKAAVDGGELERDMLTGWGMDLSHSNDDRIETSTTWMNAADDNAAFLIKINAPVNVDNQVRGLLLKANIIDNSTHAKDAARITKVTSFKSSLQGFESIKQ